MMHIYFNIRTVVTWFEQFAACFFSRIAASHSVPAVSDCDYTLGWKWPAVTFYLKF